MTDNKRVLVLAPHTDDGEFGCGGTLARLVEESCKIYYVAFSAAEKSVPLAMPSNILREEVEEATAVLGIPRENLRILRYDVREFPGHRQQILEDMIKLRAEIDPELVFLPSTSDTHQDHQTVSAEGFRAFKGTTMLGYELPWNNLTLTTTAFFELEQRHVEKKVEALQCYQSQLWRSYASEDFVRSLAQVRGVQAGFAFAETFEVIRLVVRSNLRGTVLG